MASKKKAAPAKKAPAKKKLAPAKKAVAKRIVKKHPLIDAKESKIWKDAIVKKKAIDAAKKKVVVKKTSPAKPIIKSSPVVKKKVLKKVIKVVEKIKEEEWSQKKSLASRYSHLLMPIENFDEEPLKEITESKDALSKFKYDIEVPGESAPVTEVPQEPVSEHGTTEANIVIDPNTGIISGTNSTVESVTDNVFVGEKQEMSVDPDAIVFTSPGVFVVEKDEDNYCGCKDVEGDDEEPTNEEEYEDCGDMEIIPSYNVNKKYGTYIIIIILLLLASIFVFTGNQPTATVVPATVDTIYKTDTVVLIKNDTVVVDSSKGTSKVVSVVSHKSSREKDSIAVELNKNAPPLIVKH